LEIIFGRLFYRSEVFLERVKRLSIKFLNIILKWLEVFAFKKLFLGIVRGYDVASCQFATILKPVYAK
jgi:hypothetical protein